MREFFSIRHNTAYKRGMPEIEEIASGLIHAEPCSVCGIARRRPGGDLTVRLGDTRARRWPDALACGDYPCFVVSGRLVAAMSECGIALVLGGRVSLAGPPPRGLSLEEAPTYFWVDGSRCQAAKMDFEASGYVDVRFCPGCGLFGSDISRTYQRQHYSDPPPGEVFSYDESLGHEVFTTDMGPTVFFCTERVLQCARKHKLTNVAFRRVEEGVYAVPLKV